MSKKRMVILIMLVILPLSMWLSGCLQSVNAKSGNTQGGARASSATHHNNVEKYKENVNFSNIAFFPLLKSKIGIAGALQTKYVIDSIPYMDEIRPALYSGELRFPDTTWPFLENPYPIEVKQDGSIVVHDNSLLRELHQGLRKRNIEIVHQLIGAPKQWHPYDKAQAKGAKFPMPTNLARTAEAMKLWSQLYNNDPVTWSIWNEPSHNLTGERNDQAVQEMIEIYNAYFKAMEPVDEKAQFAMANFIPWAAVPLQNLGGKSFIQAVMDKYYALRKSDPNLRLDEMTLNNYGPRVWTLLQNAREALGTKSNTTPLMLLQYGPFNPGKQWKEYAGSTLEAAKSIDNLDRFLKITDLQTVTFSGWLGHILRVQNSKLIRLPLFYALKLYSQMPVWRVDTNGNLPTGVGVMASADEHRAAVMVWNESAVPQTININLSNIPATLHFKDAQMTVYHINKNSGSPLEGEAGKFVPSQVTRIDTSSLTKSITIQGPGITYIQIDQSKGDPVLDRKGLKSASLIRNYFYSDRFKDADGKTNVRDSYCAYDAVRASAYAGMKSDQGRAVCGVKYGNLPDRLKVDIQTVKMSAKALSRESIFGIRVDYMENGKSVKSVLWHGDIFDATRSNRLPWGQGGAAADVMVQNHELNGSLGDGNHERNGSLGDNRHMMMDLKKYAPETWNSYGRKAIITFWMESTGAGSQARFLLFI